MNLRTNKAIPIESVKLFIKSLNCVDSLWDVDVKDSYINTWRSWINYSSLNKITGLDNFFNASACAGTSQAFDHWYILHSSKRMRFVKGDFAYHRATCKHSIDWCYLENDNFKEGDAFIISLPFSDYGTQHPKLEQWLEKCNELKIPVLIDCAYFGCSKNIKIDLDLYPCVKQIVFSLSKVFYGAEFLRAGIRFCRQDLDDGLDMINNNNQLSNINMSIANRLMQRYSPDWLWSSFLSEYHLICHKYQLQTTDCIIHALAPKKPELNRGTEVNRACISEPLGVIINATYT